MLKGMKKALIIGLIAMITFTGCTGTANQNSNEGGNTGTETATGNEKKTLSLGIWQGNEQEQAALDGVLKNIEEQYNIAVDKKIYTEYETQIKTDMAAKVAPDVFYLEAFIAPEMIDAGVISPLNDATLKQADIADFYPSFVDAFSKDGSVYGFPKDFSALAVFYNETLLTDAGYTADDIPENLEDWLAFFEELQGKLPEGVTALSMNQELPRLMSLLETSGDTVNKEDGTANLDAPNLIKAIDFVGSMYQEKYLRTPAQIGNSWVGDSMGTEKAAVVVEGNWMIGHLDTNFSDVKYGTKEMPKYNGKNNTLSFSVAYAVSANASDLEAANLLAYYLTNPENMEAWCAGAGVLPTRDSVAKQMKLEENPIQANIIKGADYATPWQRGLTLSIINREFNNWLPRVCTGEMTAVQAMEEAMKTANNDIESLIN